MKIFKCGRLYTPVPETEKRCIVVDGGVIEDIISEDKLPEYPDAEIIDLSAYSVGPGLVDIHCHGALNSDFADATEEDIGKAADYHLRKGTTTLLAGVGSCSADEMLSVMKCVRSMRDSLPNLHGVHLEGPYFNIEQHGCHLTDMIRNPEPEEYHRFDDYRDIIDLVTIAPELPGALDFISDYSSTGTLFSIGHSCASYDDIMAAVDCGLRHSTHLFCAMPRAYRENRVLKPGVLETVLMSDSISSEIICDGIHVGGRMAEFAVKFKGSDNLALVSDALRGVGCPPGDYAFGPRNGKICRMLDDPRVGVVPESDFLLASSAVVLSDGLRILSESSQISLSELWKMASLTPARILGIQTRKGSIAPGKDADFLVLDSDANVAQVFTAGQKV